MKNIKSDKNEKAILRSIEAGEWEPVTGLKARMRQLQKYAKSTLQKDQRVNIRLSSKVLHGLQRRAVREGIPYQTLMSSIIHKYVLGYLTDKSA
jgi:predicted DNA binding CopG/RHH family protein